VWNFGNDRDFKKTGTHVKHCRGLLFPELSTSRQKKKLSRIVAMKTIQLVGQVDQQHRLSAEVPAEVPPGPVKLSLIVNSDVIEEPLEDEISAAWDTGIAQEWSDELSDSRQDIYTLADGEAVDETIKLMTEPAVNPAAACP
jgi:hypothetical protein